MRRTIGRFCAVVPPPLPAAAATATSVSSSSAQGDATEKKQRKFRFESGYSDKGTNYEERGAFFSTFMGAALMSLGCSFLFVPLYRIFCAPAGHGADPRFYTVEGQLEREERSKEMGTPKKLMKMRFLSDVGNTMPIAFVPLQKEIEMLVGEPALAFYSAYNRSTRTLLGVSSYTIAPPEATNYLNKIQCFCFEEQRFKPHELVEMPVFFFIDRDMLHDPLVNWLDEMILNYTFFNLERTREVIMRQS
ncbi:cytochrome c oxidase assembly, putative [Bodo saltans]|uniref:Cytochrome c oxidase assembly, putative n=1 Tax=Bodo saltans TaxID=75058 RepID=A0A0S4JH88_BODSA|nr:cytochrome c oxidase assembly, putative [Bodo saltans]|eukprot:CUG89458.1 cytochrome c oxidase assembly, putative [Bodo saltans]